MERPGDDSIATSDPGVGLHVLVVEDEPDLVVLSRLILEAEGFTVSTAADGRAALAQLEQGLPDVVLLDVMLPRVSGWDVLRQLRADPRTADLPVVILTAKVGAGDQRLAWTLGASDFLGKPYELSQLLQAIHGAIERSDPEAREAHGRRMLGKAQLTSGNPHEELFGIIRHAQDAIVSVTMDGLITNWNPAAERMFGFSPEEAIGQSLQLIMAPDQLEQVNTTLAAIAAGEELERAELVRRRKDGSSVLVSRVAVPIHDEEGRPVGSWGVLREVEQSGDSMFRSLLESAPDAMVIVDQAGRIAIVNAQAENLFGYEREELLGQSIEKLIPARHRDRHPARVAEYFAAPRLRPIGLGQQLTGLHRDGREIPVEISLSPLATEDGLLVSAAIRDVTDHRRSEALFRGLLESAPDAKLIVDEQGYIVLVSARTEEMFGYGREELVGRSVDLVLHPALPCSSAQREHVGIRKGGAEFPVEVSVSPLITDTGTLLSASLRDITQRRRERHALTQAYEREQEVARGLRGLDVARADFISTVSHELRTPLTVVMGFARMLEARWETLDDATRLHLLGRISASGQKLEQLIADMLDLSRLEQGRLDVSVEVLPLDELVRSTIQRVAALLGEHPLEVDIPVGLCVLADPVAFARVLDNLLTNAAKFSPRATRITVAAERASEREVVVRVTDCGPGVPAAERERVFDRFYRIADERGVVPGTGIGLAIAREFVECQGGRIWVEPTGTVGSAFCFTVPTSDS